MATIYTYRQGNYEFRDEHGDFTAEDVKQQLVQYFPELANATTEKSETDGDTVVTFVKRAGTKGLTETLSDNDLQHLRLLVEQARRDDDPIELPADVLSKLLAEVEYSRALFGSGVKRDAG